MLRVAVVVFALCATPLTASGDTLGGLIGAGVSGNWLKSDVAWYGNFTVNASLWWRERVALVVDGGVSPGGADRGQLWGGGGVRVSPLRTPFDEGYWRSWLELGVAYERWGAREMERRSETRTMFRAGIGYDLAYRGGLGSQAYLRVQRGRAIEGETTTELAATTFIIGLGVVYDL
jgi:hypothetical protein